MFTSSVELDLQVAIFYAMAPVYAAWNYALFSISIGSILTGHTKTWYVTERAGVSVAIAAEPDGAAANGHANGHSNGHSKPPKKGFFGRKTNGHTKNGTELV